MQVTESNLAFFPIKDPTGRKAGRLAFIPKDVGFFYRGVETMKRLQKATELFGRCILLLGDRTVDPVLGSILHETEQQFAKDIDYICGVKTADLAFQEYRPFAVMPDGSFWAQSVVAALGKINIIVSKNAKI